MGGTFRIFSGHDYPPADGSRGPSCVSTVKDQMALNKHVGGTPQKTLEAFTKMRQERDGGLGTPKLLHMSLQVNLRGGKMPVPDQDGQRRLKVPLSGDLPL